MVLDFQKSYEDEFSHIPHTWFPLLLRLYMSMVRLSQIITNIVISFITEEVHTLLRFPSF